MRIPSRLPYLIGFLGFQSYNPRTVKVQFCELFQHLTCKTALFFHCILYFIAEFHVLLCVSHLALLADNYNYIYNGNSVRFCVRVKMCQSMKP